MTRITPGKESKLNMNDNNILSEFVERFEHEMNMRKKMTKSEEEQVASIGIVFENYIRYYSNLRIRSSKIIKGANPHYLMDFYKSEDVEEIMEALRKSFMELGVRFKHHRFSGSLGMFSCKNDTVPGLLEGRGYFLTSFSSGFKSRGPSIKIECLRENQVVKILDGKIDNLTLVYWNGRGMSRSTFLPRVNPTEDIDICEETGFLNVDLISTSKRNVVAKGEFTMTLNDGLILERITSLDQG